MYMYTLDIDRARDTTKGREALACVSWTGKAGIRVCLQGYIAILYLYLLDYLVIYSIIQIIGDFIESEQQYILYVYSVVIWIIFLIAQSL